jgi:hypothetical protein
MTSCSKLDDAVTGKCSGLVCLGEHKRFQTVDDALNDVRQVLESWHENLAMQNRAFSESYARHGATVICDLEMTVPLERLGNVADMLDNPIADRKLYASLVYRCNSSQHRELVMCNQQAVFVFDVETVKSEDDFTVSSHAGLYDIHDESLDLFAGVLFQSIDGPFKVITRFLDREVSIVRIGRDRLKPSMIQGGSKVVNRVPQDQKKFVGEWLSRGDAESIVSAIDVRFDGQFVRVSLRKNLPFGVKIVDVMFGPF